VYRTARRHGKAHALLKKSLSHHEVENILEIKDVLLSADPTNHNNVQTWNVNNLRLHSCYSRQRAILKAIDQPVAPGKGHQLTA
jgi:hypothetical protein